MLTQAYIPVHDTPTRDSFIATVKKTDNLLLHSLTLFKHYVVLFGSLCETNQ